MNNSYNPAVRRGDVFYADLNDIRGSEQGGIRPVICIQNDVGNMHSPTTIVAPVTTRIKRPLPTHVDVDDSGALREGSKALLEQVRTIDKSRLLAYITTLDAARMRDVDEAIRVGLGLKQYRHLGEYEICLCSKCADTFYNMRDRVIQRVYPLQVELETCDFCQTRKGYDCRIWPRIPENRGDANV